MDSFNRCMWDYNGGIKWKEGGKRGMTEEIQGETAKNKGYVWWVIRVISSSVFISWLLVKVRLLRVRETRIRDATFFFDG